MPDEPATPSSTHEALISVDIEASGPSPSTGSLISLGACLLDDPEVALYLELKPVAGMPWSHAAQLVHGLDRERLERDGMDPAQAMAEFESWLAQACSGHQPVFVGFNAAFDWMFVNDYFQRYLGRNPFGPAALDVKAYYMGRYAIGRWAETTRAYVNQRLGLETEHSHNALEDAREQAAVMRLLRTQAD